ncbi:MAG: formylglycine-generating enzyme family protein [Kiritimatiellae bacterium]|nr:formylglycine-generating enzyme family protein [Kiritimatiellia bacterium]MBR3822848.1 formylglycine-generating enzyme family protein [Kiritimatiellia bacterium]
MSYRNLMLTVVFGIQAVSASGPWISDIKVDSKSHRTVHVSYTLSGCDAFVTADILTNGVSIGPQCFHRLEGDVNAVVGKGENRLFTWDARKDWPDRKLDVTVKLTASRDAPDFVVIDLLDGGKKKFYPSAADVPGGITDDVYKTDKMILRRIHAAGVEWRMGQPVNGEPCEGNTDIAREAYLRDNETAHKVTFTNDFYIGIYTVTQRQYYHVTGEHPSYRRSGSPADLYAGSAAQPVEQVSYDMLRGETTEEFPGWPRSGRKLAPGAKLLAFREKLGLASVDLPTEAQWEFACRAGTGTSLNNGKNCVKTALNNVDPSLDLLGWYGNTYGNAGGQVIHPVGLKTPNAWDLYDMHGNVHEWCLDWLSTGDDYRATFAADWKEGGVTVDPVGPSSGTSRVVRGGDYFYAATYARSACRAAIIALPCYVSVHYGFRIVCSGTLD